MMQPYKFNITKNVLAFSFEKFKQTVEKMSLTFSSFIVLTSSGAADVFDILP